MLFLILVTQGVDLKSGFAGHTTRLEHHDLAVVLTGC